MGREAIGRAPGAVPQLILALECGRPAAAPSRHVLGDVTKVVIGRGAVRDAARGKVALELRVPDGAMSLEHAVLLRLQGRWVLEDQQSKNGTLVNGRAATRRALVDGDLLELGRTLLLYRDAVPPVDGPDDVDVQGLGSPPHLETFVASLARDAAALRRIAGSQVPVLIFGATGTGKEIVARALHELSRRPGPFVAVNCGALPETLVEAELFGHRRGAFSGALEDRPGYVRSAARGTLFLDEIGDLPLTSQPALLRFLQEREVVPVGEARPTKVDVRVAAATHRDLDEAAGRDLFRRDLLARLSGFTVRLPALAERREDLGILIGSLLRRACEGALPTLSAAAGRALFLHTWPQNVRELEMALRTAVALSADGTISLEHLPLPVRAAATPLLPDESPVNLPIDPDEEKLREELSALLATHKGNIAAVARAMGKGRMQIHRWIRRFALRIDGYRT